ncbi:hypothetical protein G9A89_016863 [Geosiphon pyriformis]|nr:hypothetical protein G9A89_016863 [Geosiphon pyriformis]
MPCLTGTPKNCNSVRTAITHACQLPVELGLHLTKITGCKHTITASHATENDMAIQNNKTSETTNHVSLVENNYSMKEYGTTFLDKEKCVMLYANTQSLSVTGNNNEGIMSKYAHNTDAGFDLRYSGKKAIKLEPYSCTCIDFKVALKILATIMVQLASRNSLAKKGINIRGGIIDTEYVGNIIAILQNDSERTYIIKPNKKIAQTIFLSLMKVAQLVSVGNKEELGITVKEIQRFGSTDRINMPVNMAEKKVIDKKKIISTH